jgi:hypothetical protein
VLRKRTRERPRGAAAPRGRAHRWRTE